MSTNTLVLRLFEYDPNTDANLPFSITDALNNNWDKIDSLVPLLSTIAAPFNPEQSYAVGAYCTYQGNLQRCNTNIPTGEVWNPSHWDAVTIMSQSVNSGQINQPNGVAGLEENGSVSVAHGGTGATTAQDAVLALGALFAIAAAAAYNPSGTYAVGDYCTNDGNLYKCNTPIPDGEAWTAEHWTDTTVAAELTKKAEWKPNNWKSETDPPSSYPGNSATSFFSGNPFGGIDQCIVSTWVYNLNAARQVISFLDNSGVKYRLSIGGDQWGEWKTIATATPPQEGNIPVVDGIREIGQCMYFQQQDGTTHFFVVAGAGSDGAQISNNQNFAVAPIGARPKAQYYYPAVAVSGGNTLNGYVSVNPDGTIVWVGNAVPYPGYIVSFGAFAIEKEG